MIIIKKENKTNEEEARVAKRSSHSSVHVLVVNLTFADATKRQAWATWWTPLAERVYANEPNCLAYEMSFATQSDTEAIIIERYVSKSDLDGIHQGSIKAHVDLHGPPEAGEVQKKLTHFTESNIGHMDRPTPDN